MEDNSQAPEQLQASAKELRAEAAEADINGIRAAAVVLAERYEAASPARVGSA